MRVQTKARTDVRAREGKECEMTGHEARKDMKPNGGAGTNEDRPIKTT